MAYRLEVTCDQTGVGDQLAVTGSSLEFGNWDTSQAIRLQTSEETFPVWEAPVSAAILSCEFKCIILRSSGEITWEAIPNRCWHGRTCMQPYGSSLRTSFDLDELHIRPRERQSAISFKATVSVSEVPHLGQTELKRDLWWTPEDFQAFLKIRIALANEYKEAVKEKRLRASGSWDIQDPTLKQESRRGLGLGRMKLRQNNTRAYLAAVVNEQSRQRRECNWSHSIVLDDAKLADVGRRISESDVKASIERAQRDYASVRKEIDENFSKTFEKERTEESIEQPEQEPNPPSPKESDSESPQSSGFGMKRVESVTLVDREEEDSDDDSSSFLSERRLPDMSKGFGLSRDVLHDAGLRANGRKDDSVGAPLNGGGLRSTVSATDLQKAKGYGSMSDLMEAQS